MIRVPCRGLVPALVLIAAASAEPAQGQVSEMALEVGASTVTPPADVEGDAGRYLVAGARFTHFSTVGSGVNAAFLFGQTADDATGGSYLSAGVDARLWKGLAGGWYLGLEAGGWGFQVREPYSYRAVAVEGGPVLEYRGRRVQGTLRGVAGAGRSRTDVLTEVAWTQGMHRRGDPGTALVTLEEDLWRYGAEAEFLAGSGTVAAGVAGGAHHTPAGDYRSVGGRLLGGWTGGAAELRVDYWDTPVGTQTTGGLSFVIPMGGWGVRGFFGRSEPDPLTLTEPGRGSGGVLLSRRVAGSRSVAGPAPLYEITHADAGEATISMRVRAPVTATSVAVLGDFTLWEPVAMTRDDDVWAVSLEAPVGVHHFGFLVDGEWFLPEDVPDAVPDEWGRMNATLVIER